MRTFAQKPKATQQADTATSATPDRARLGQTCIVNSILHVQRTIGNQAAQRLLEGNPRNGKEESIAAGIPRFGHDFSQIPVHSFSPVGIQPKLAVSTPGDIYEQEADRVADMVMQVPDRGTSRVTRDESDTEGIPLILGVQEKIGSGKPKVQRRGGLGADGPKLEPQIGARIQAIRGEGRALTTSERGFMEPRFGADFSVIRIHTNQEADTHSRALHARAFTLGSDIFFRAGEYTPGKAKGHRLLAHELTHTIQQGAANPLNGLQISSRNTALPLLQRQPAPPGPAPVALPAGRATVNFLPVIMDLAPSAWGVTSEDDAVIDITAFASGATWKCVITTADQQAHQGVRLLPGVVDVTPALVAGEMSCPTLQTMITSLKSVTSTGVTTGPHSGFYMLSAVQAHENVHITQYRADLAPHYTTLKTTVEALTVPLAGNADAAAAKAAIKALPAFTAAMATFHTGDVTANNKTARHTLAAPFLAAMLGVVDPMISTINARRTALKCAP